MLPASQGCAEKFTVPTSKVCAKKFFLCPNQGCVRRNFFYAQIKGVCEKIPPRPLRGRGGIGRRVRFRILCSFVQVQVLSPVPQTGVPPCVALLFVARATGFAEVHRKFREEIAGAPDADKSIRKHGRRRLCRVQVCPYAVFEF